MTKYIKALKTNEFTNTGDWYKFHQGHNSLFHVQNGVEHIAIDTKKVKNQGNIFIKNSDCVFDLKKVKSTNKQYNLYEVISDNRVNLINGGNVQFVSKDHLKQIINERVNDGINYQEYISSIKTVDLNNRNILGGYPLDTVIISFFDKNKKKPFTQFVLIPE